MLSPSVAEQILGDQLLPAFWTERERLDRIDRWLRWDHDDPHMPRDAQITDEYKEINARSITPWGDLIVTTVAQALRVTGYRTAGQADESPAWKAWKRNRMQAKQNGLHRSGLGYGHAGNVVRKGVDGRGDEIPVITSLSARQLLTFDGDSDVIDDFPAYGLWMEPTVFSDGSTGWRARVIDDGGFHLFYVGFGGGLKYVTTDLHDMGVTPIARFINLVDLEGRTDGEIESVIPLLGRIDQTTFDRMLLQRFQSFGVRFATGMQQPETDEERRAAEIILKHGDLLVSDSPDTKFGMLPAADVSPLAEAAHNSDLRDLAAIKQIPAHFLLGTLTNIGAEALAAADAALNRKIQERQTSFGVGHQTTFQLCALALGDEDGFYDYESEVKWEDPEVRSLSQAADALGKMAEMLNVPVEMLWERIPGFTEDDVERAKELISSGDSVDQLIAAVMQDRAMAEAEAMAAAQPEPPPAEQP